VIALRCNIPRLEVDDVFPRIVLVQGTVTEVEANTLRKSKTLQASIQRNEVTVVPRMDKKAGRTPPSAAKLPPPEWSEVHNLLVTIAERDSPQGETNDLLRQILNAIEGLHTRLENLPKSAPVYVQQGATPQPPTSNLQDAPTFIPTQIRSGNVKATNLKVEETKGDAGLGDAEEALRNMKRGK
jgi:hypothetical protein